MISIFIDSSALIALHNQNDSLHGKAYSILTDLNKTDVTPVISLNIISETTTVISQRIGKKEALIALDDLRSGRYIVVDLDEKAINIAEEIFKKEKSKNLSYSDCLSFAVMKVNNLTKTFSFDSHFKKYGFIRIGIDED